MPVVLVQITQVTYPLPAVYEIKKNGAGREGIYPLRASLISAPLQLIHTAIPHGCANRVNELFYPAAFT